MVDASTALAEAAFEKPTEMRSALVLPNCIPRVKTQTVIRHGVPWTAVYCANCGKHGGWVPEDAYDFAFYLCESPCAEKWEPLAGVSLVPDEIFWERVKQAQLEEFGRLLSHEEVVEFMKDEHNVLSKLARDRDIGNRRGGGLLR